MKIYNLKKEESYLLPLFAIDIEGEKEQIFKVSKDQKGLFILNKKYSNTVESILNAEGVRFEAGWSGGAVIIRITSPKYRFVLPSGEGPVTKIRHNRVVVCDEIDGDITVTTSEGYKSYTSDNIAGI